MVSLDLHGNTTAAILTHAAALSYCHEYPHIEVFAGVAGPANDAHALGPGPIDMGLAGFEGVEVDIGAAGGVRAARGVPP